MAGSAIVVLAGLGAFGGGSLDEQLHTALQHFEGWCLSEGFDGPSLDYLTQASLGLPGFPELPGKAADCRKSFGWLALVTAAYSLGQGRMAEVMATCCYCMALFWNILDKSPMFLTDEEAGRAREAGEGYLRAYVWLAGDALERRHCRWKVRPKMHSFHHTVLALRHSRLNPRFMTCWGDEDYVGKLAKISRKAHVRTLALATLRRYLAACAEQWSQ
jgi:hypothetical protein